MLEARVRAKTQLGREGWAGAAKGWGRTKWGGGASADDFEVVRVTPTRDRECSVNISRCTASNDRPKLTG